MATNPFTPTFGAPPPLLVGRSDMLDAFQDALDEGPGSPGYATLFTGGRGVGKTAMLNAAEDLAREAGFAVISETATHGFVDRLRTEHLPKLLPRTRRRVKAVDVASVGAVTLEDAQREPKSLRELMDAVTLRQPVLVTVDEVHAGVLDELREFAVVLQHSIREGRRLAFCAAGLPQAVDGLVKDKVLTFLRRADRQLVGAVDVRAVKAAFVQVINENGRTIADSTAELAARATGGYPFMVQLVGYHAWRQSPRRREVTRADVEAGAEAARRRVGRLVIEPALEDLSAVDRNFLRQMSVDDGPSKTADVTKRMGVDANYASQYRLRLIAAGMIVATGHGRIDFALPHLRDWLREHT